MKPLHKRRIRWGIIGPGKIAHKFAQDLVKVEDAELYAVASRTQEKANEFAKLYGAEQAYSSYESLAEDADIDAVYIATPHVFHKENSILCLEKGLAVLCEKAFAMNLSDVQEMIDCAQKNNVLLMEALWTYFLPHYQYVLDLLKNKRFGKVKKLKADFGFKPVYDESDRVIKKSLGGGSLLDIGIYPIFAALSILGEPKKIEANATFFKNDVDSSCTMLFKYPEGVEAHLKSTLLEQTPTEAIIEFEQATVRINSRFHGPSNVTIITYDKEETIDFEYTTNGYSYEIEHFNDLIRRGKTESHIMTFEFSKLLMKTMDSVREIIGLNY